MLGLDAYGSDDSDREDSPPPAPSKPLAKPNPPQKRKPVRFTVDLPKASAAAADDDDDAPVAKKPRLAGAGSSSLLAMLPPPSKKSAPAPAQPERTLGGAGSGSFISRPRETNIAADLFSASSSLLPRPEVEHAPVKSASNFFSLGETSTSRDNPILVAPPTPVQTSSAPEVQEYKPPPPTPADPYPGYYKMPSGRWAAYDPGYYRQFWEEWQESTMPQREKGFEGADKDDLLTVDARDEMDRARQEREEKKALTANIPSGPTAPNMNIKRAKVGSVARSRHQLSTLLTDAYENREVLEAKIADARRNRKESGNKYGFF